MKKSSVGMICYTDVKDFGFAPVVILKEIKNSEAILVAPIFKKSYNTLNIKTHVKIRELDKIRPNSYVYLEKCKMIYKKQIKSYVGKLYKKEIINMIDILKGFFNGKML